MLRLLAHYALAIVVVQSLVAIPPARAMQAGPAATRAPACANPNADVALELKSPVQYPDSARALTIGTKTVTLTVTVDERGRAVSAAIQQSAGNAAIDHAAVEAAMSSYYLPKLANCVHVQGSYAFSVTISAPRAISTPSVVACAIPNMPASIVQKAAARYPQSAQDLGLGVVSPELSVVINADGTFKSATVLKSANNSAVDRSAILAARNSTYQPEIVNCTPTESTVQFDVTIAPNT